MLGDRERRPAHRDPPELPGVEPEPLVADRLDHQRAGAAALGVHPHHAPRAPQPDQRADEADPHEQEDEPADVPVIDHVTKQARDEVADQAGVQQRTKHDEDGEEPMRRLPPLVAEVKGTPPHGKPDKYEKRDDARECQPGTPRAVSRFSR